MRAMVTAARTAASALNTQCTQPVAALSAYTAPLCVPTNTRPPTIVGCASALSSPGKPNAHLSFRRGTSAAVSPGHSPLLIPRVRGVHAPAVPARTGERIGEFARRARHIACGGRRRAERLREGLPGHELRDRPALDAGPAAAIESIAPLSSAVSTRSGVIACSASRVGARPCPVSWHEAQICL